LESVYYRLNFPQIDPQKTGFRPSFLFLRHSSGCTIALVEPSGVKWAFMGSESGFQVGFSSSDTQQVYSQLDFFTGQTGLENGWGTSLANAKAEVQGRKPGAALDLKSTAQGKRENGVSGKQSGQGRRQRAAQDSVCV
jgi:hypothetical protein